jgi:hypothetical protein
MSYSLFRAFAKLPPEIQDSIWRRAMPQREECLPVAYYASVKVVPRLSDIDLTDHEVQSQIRDLDPPTYQRI